MSELHDQGPDLRSVWQGTTEPGYAVSLDEVRKRARRFRDRIVWRNRREFAACVIIVVVFGGYSVHFQPLLMKIGAVLTCIAAVFVAFVLYSKGRAGRGDLSGDCRSFHIEEVRRQYELLRTVWLWYLLPFVPGLVLFQIGESALAPANRQMPVLIVDAVGVFVFLFIGWFNHKAARRLERELDQLMQGQGS